MAKENQMDAEGIDPAKLKAMDDLVYGRILAGAPDPNDTEKVMKVTACLGTCLAQMLADPTPEQALKVKSHLFGHVLDANTAMLLGTIAELTGQPVTAPAPKNRVKSHLN